MTASINEKVVVAYVDNEVAQAKDEAIALADEGPKMPSRNSRSFV